MRNTRPRKNFHAYRENISVSNSWAIDAANVLDNLGKSYLPFYQEIPCIRSRRN